MEYVKFIADSLKLLSRKNPDGVLCLVCGLLLFLPAPALKALRIAEYTDKYGYIFGVCFLIAIACLVNRVFLRLVQYLVQIARNRAARKRQVRILQSLSDNEKEILRHFATSEHGELSFNRSKKAILTLVDKGVLLDLRPSLNDKLPTRDYRVAPAYMEHLNSYL